MDVSRTNRLKGRFGRRDKLWPYDCCENHGSKKEKKKDRRNTVDIEFKNDKKTVGVCQSDVKDNIIMHR